MFPITTLCTVLHTPLLLLLYTPLLVLRDSPPLGTNSSSHDTIDSPPLDTRLPPLGNRLQSTWYTYCRIAS
jgi:hypothetical protein